MKRSGFKPRVKPLAGMLRTADLPAPKKPRPRKCAVKTCRTPFTPYRSFENWCSPECGAVIAQGKLEKKSREIKAQQRREKLAEKRKDAARKLELKSVSELKPIAQEAFNAWIRYRDRNECCIDCDKPFEPNKPGGSIDAGHYLSRGSADHLRFDERNVHAQRKNCNRPGGATRQAFRNGLIKRIGLEAVEALEADQTIVKWTREGLLSIITTYRAKLKEAKARDKSTGVIHA